MSGEVTVLAEAAAEVRAEVARVDGKAAALASVAALLMTVGTAGLVTLDLPATARWCGWAGVAAVTAAIVLLVAALTPKLSGKGGVQVGPLAWRHRTPAQVLALCDPGNAPARAEAEANALIVLSGLAHSKWRCVRSACVMLLLGLAYGVVAGVLAGLS